MIILITGTNTDVGKTIATAALALRYQEAGHLVDVIKPIQTGSDDSDIRDIENLTGITGTEFAHYPEPLAPNLAARRANLPQLNINDVAQRIIEHNKLGTVVLVEGAGGLLVRMAEDWTLADLAIKLRAPLIVVTSTGLGSLNLAELTVEAARIRSINVLGLIGGSIPAEPDLATRLNLEEFPKVTGVRLLGCLPAGAGELSKEQFRQVAAEIDLPK